MDFRLNGIIDCGERHKHIHERALLLVEQIKDNQSPLVTYLLEGPTGSGKTSMAATIGIESDFPYVKMIYAENMIGLGEATKCAQIVKACSSDEDGLLGFDIHSDGHGQRQLTVLARDERMEITSSMNGYCVSRLARGSSQRSQNTRGRTVMRDVHSLGPNDLLVVRFNERGQPYGEMQPTLSNFVGTIARNGNLLPLSFLDWRKIPKNRLDLAWGYVTEHFCIPTRHKKIVMQMMGVAWRRWRAEVKATSYDPNIPLDELLQIRPVPHKLTLEVWETLCDYWKKNEENGVKPTRIEILELSCHSKKKGRSPIADEAIQHEALLNEAVKRHLQDMPEGQIQDNEVFGPEHSGRVRCLGAGALPSQVFPDQYKRSHCQGYDTTSDATEKFKEMKEKIKEMEAREVEREARLQAEIEAREAQRKTEMEQSMRRMQEQQFQNFIRIMQSMMVGTAGGSQGPETLPGQMASVMAEIMQQYMSIPSNAQENIRRPPP
ncbi:hypothetical protein ZIOFF_010594 [Zingiber officinale]|uniref:Uncharacterized protein n=1 Tax=Zingiber officinale TaxID=94328 RepID=A0A8J5HP95_ZINOF|nr:hypothetical protein ZIOFF_010594 [Zingiber officinale]